MNEKRYYSHDIENGIEIIEDFEATTPEEAFFMVINPGPQSILQE
jgi:hypothetical protein